MAACMMRLPLFMIISHSPQVSRGTVNEVHSAQWSQQRGRPGMIASNTPHAYDLPTTGA